jgi:hypothetical protein
MGCAHQAADSEIFQGRRAFASNFTKPVEILFNFFCHDRILIEINSYDRRHYF